jgi:alcohol dehydrogenase
MLVVRTAAKFEWQMSARVVFGLGAIDSIADRARSLGMTRPMVVTDKGIADTDDFKAAIKKLEAGGTKPLVWPEVKPDPPDTSVHEGAKVYLKSKCDGLIGFGGGSSMDTARGIGCVAMNGGRINDYFAVNEEKLPINNMPPLICVPTTAGTAAEVTNVCVISDTARHQKFACTDPLLYAKVALLDPALTFSLPQSLTASTGMDALCHAVGGYISNMENPVSDALILYAVELISKNLRRAVYTPDDAEARTNMLLGSVITGLGFGNSFPSLDHSVGHALGAVFHISHGLACTLCLPQCLEFKRPARMEKMAKLAEVFGINTIGMTDEEASRASIEAIEELMFDVGIPTLTEATGGMTEDDVNRVTEKVMSDMCTGCTPRPITAEQVVTEILQRALAE